MRLRADHLTASLIILLGLGLSLLNWPFITQLFVAADGSLFYSQDVPIFYRAAQHALNGDIQSLYLADIGALDEALTTRNEEALNALAPFPYPPVTFLVIAPLAWLSLGAAKMLWVILGIAAMITPFLIPPINRHFPWLRQFPLPLQCLIVLSCGMQLLLLATRTGQLGIMLGPVLLLALALRRNRPAVAGVMLGLLIIKPQLALALPLLFLLERNWRLLLIASITALMLIAASIALYGIEPWHLYPQPADRFSQLVLSDLQAHHTNGVSFFNAFISNGIDANGAFMGHFLICMMAISGFIYARTRLDYDVALIALTLGLTMLLSPYARLYDMTLLPYLILTLCELSKAKTKAVDLLLIGVLCVFPLYNGMSAQFGFPLMLLLTGWRIYILAPKQAV